MGAFKIEIVGVGGHGCERKARAGEKLHGRCGRFNCPDCMAFEFVQQLRQKGMVRDGDGAYSVLLEGAAAQAVRDHIKDQKIEPTYKAPDGGTSLDYWEITHNLPEGAKCIGVSRNGDVFVNYPMKAEFVHWPGDEKNRVVDDMLKNERRNGHF